VVGGTGIGMRAVIAQVRPVPVPVLPILETVGIRTVAEP